jgi:hypothetical protein
MVRILNAPKGRGASEAEDLGSLLNSTIYKEEVTPTMDNKKIEM